MKRLLLVLFIGLHFTSAQSQNKIQFHSQNYIGLLEGSKGCLCLLDGSKGTPLEVTTINGIQYKTWFVGLGTGLDWYFMRTVPLFISLNKDFKQDKNTWFASLDAGTNFEWAKGLPQGDFYYSKFTPGFFGRGGIGYKAYFRQKKEAFLFGIGYSFKRVKERKEVGIYCISPPCPTTFEFYDSKLNRLSIRLGLQF
ncbi:MAG: hypothetical protein ACKVOW_00800 [Chitinophagaceae bacterium]